MQRPMAVLILVFGLNSFTLADNLSDIQQQTALINAQAALKQAQVANDFATYNALKTALGAPPNVGKEGAVTIAAGAEGTQLLRSRKSSLEAVEHVAKALCGKLDSNAADIVIVPSDYDTKSQSAHFLMGKFNAAEALVDSNDHEIKSAVTIPVILGVISLGQTLLGSAADLSKVFRSDTSLVTTGADRTELFETELGKECNNKIDIVKLENHLRSKSFSQLENFSRQVLKMQQFIANVASRKQSSDSAIAENTKNLDAEKAKDSGKQDKQLIKQLTDRHNELQKAKAQLQAQDSAATVVAAFLETLKGQDAVVLDAATWGGGDAILNGKKRLTYSLVVQDVQVVKDGTFSGKTMGRTSTAEVVYRVFTESGKVLDGGYISHSTSQAPIDLTAGED